MRSEGADPPGPREFTSPPASVSDTRKERGQNVSRARMAAGMPRQSSWYKYHLLVLRIIHQVFYFQTVFFLQRHLHIRKEAVCWSRFPREVCPPYGKLTLGWEEDSKEGAIERSFYIVRHNMGDTISGGGGHTESLATPIYIVGPWPYHVW